MDILVNNAGITRDMLTMMMQPNDFTDVIDLNLKVHTRCFCHAMPFCNSFPRSFVTVRCGRVCFSARKRPSWVP